MKSERRHELEKNELADWIAGIVAKIKPYQNAILGIVLLAVVGGGVYLWMSRRSTTEAGAAWDQLYAVTLSGTADPAEFDAVAEKFPGTATADWATLIAGEVHLSRGCNELFTSKTLGREDLKQAEERFRKVLDETRSDALRERATFDLAQANEANGDLSKAIETWSSPSLKDSGQKPDRGYRGVVNRWPGTTYADMAQKRLEDLQRTSTKVFYDRFAKWEPKKASLSDEPGTPGVRPPTDFTPPPEGPLYTPSDPTKAGAGKSTPGGLPDLGPLPSKKPAAAEKPAAAKGPAPAAKPGPGPAPKAK